MNFLVVTTKIWGFINSKLFVIVIITILLLIVASQCKSKGNLKRELFISEQNRSAAEDSIKVYKNRLGDLVSEKSVWILTERELKEQNRVLYEQVSNQRGTVISLNRAIISLLQDSIMLSDSINFLKSTIGQAQQLDKTEWRFPWKLEYTWDKDNYDMFSGYTLISVDTINFDLFHKTTNLIDRESRIHLTFGEKVVDNKFNVFIATKYPGFTTESLEGVFIDPNTNRYIKQLIKKRHWFAGWSVNFGVTAGYDFLHNKPALVIGPSFGYTIYQW